MTIKSTIAAWSHHLITAVCSSKPSTTIGIQTPTSKPEVSRSARARQPPGEQGKHYAAFIEAQLKIEQDRRESINSRATSMLTAVTGLATLLLAVFAVLLGKNAVLTGCWERSFLAAALLCLMASAFHAVVALKPRPVEGPTVGTMRTFLREPRFRDTEIRARARTSFLNVEAIEVLRNDSDKKAQFLRRAAVLQAAAITAMTASAVAILMSSTPNAPTVAPAPPSTSTTMTLTTTQATPTSPSLRSSENPATPTSMPSAEPSRSP